MGVGNGDPFEEVRNGDGAECSGKDQVQAWEYGIGRHSPSLFSSSRITIRRRFQFDCTQSFISENKHMPQSMHGQLLVKDIIQRVALSCNRLGSNDQLLPFAYAMVEAETKDSWSWFFSLLKDDLGHDKIMKCTFMSDQ
ncbi:hypothetical protein PIB30_000745 [Stylosanthes scabra]|uniref:MULE transposase domain-containing protein n=1 Tax=Stylosanthes scabra TaxID=79078 RepID=A0ABU6YZI4_9FABA|nr:hypothetical protein [Stylosanthes scabra]